MFKSLNNLHHAYLVVSGAEEAERLLRVNFNTVGSPDYFVFKEKIFGIDDARKLSKVAICKAFGERKILLILPEKIN